MTVKDYLWQLKNIDKRIKDKMDEAQRWRDIAENSTSQLSKDKVQTSPKHDKMADAITNAVQYERESEDLARRLTEFKHHVTLQIDNIDDIRHYDALKMFFVKDMTYVQMQAQMDKSYRHVRREVDRAIDVFGSMYSDEIEKSEKIW